MRLMLRAAASSGWLPAFAVGAAAVLAVVLYDASIANVAVFGAYVAFGIALPGTLWIRLLRGRATHIAEDLALGLAVGYCIEVATYIPSRALGVPLLFLLWPILTLVGFAAIPTLRRHWKGSGIRAPIVWSWTLAAIAGTLLVYSRCIVLRAAPSRRQRYAVRRPPLPPGPDRRAAPSRPAADPVCRRVPLAYHWFFYADAAATSWATGIEPVSLLYRLSVLPMFAAFVVLTASPHAGCRPAGGPVRSRSRSRSSGRSAGATWLDRRTGLRQRRPSTHLDQPDEPVRPGALRRTVLLLHRSPSRGCGRHAARGLAAARDPRLRRSPARRRASCRSSSSACWSSSRASPSGDVASTDRGGRPGAGRRRAGRRHDPALPRHDGRPDDRARMLRCSWSSGWRGRRGGGLSARRSCHSPVVLVGLALWSFLWAGRVRPARASPHGSMIGGSCCCSACARVPSVRRSCSTYPGGSQIYFLKGAAGAFGLLTAAGIAALVPVRSRYQPLVGCVALALIAGAVTVSLLRRLGPASAPLLAVDRLPSGAAPDDGAGRGVGGCCDRRLPGPAPSRTIPCGASRRGALAHGGPRHGYSLPNAVRVATPSPSDRRVDTAVPGDGIEVARWIRDHTRSRAISSPRTCTAARRRTCRSPAATPAISGYPATPSGTCSWRAGRTRHLRSRAGWHAARQRSDRPVLGPTAPGGERRGVHRSVAGQPRHAARRAGACRGCSRTRPTRTRTPLAGTPTCCSDRVITRSTGCGRSRPRPRRGRRRSPPVPCRTREPMSATSVLRPRDTRR